MAEGEEKERIGEELVKAVEKEIEPLLEGAGPFFGGNETLTLAEVCFYKRSPLLSSDLSCGNHDS